MADIGKDKISNVVRKAHIVRRKIRLLKDVKFRMRFEETVIELVDVGSPNLWKHFKGGVLMACDEVYGEMRGRRSKGDTWWWNEEMKKAVSRKKGAHKAMCRNSSEGNKRRYKGMKNKAKKAVLKEMRKKAEETLPILRNYSKVMFRLIKRLKIDSKEVKGGRCMRGSDGKLCFSEKQKGTFWKSYMERIMNEENDWDHNVKGDAVEAPVVCVS